MDLVFCSSICAIWFCIGILPSVLLFVAFIYHDDECYLLCVAAFFREVDLNSQLCISMSGKKTIITNPKVANGHVLRGFKTLTFLNFLF